MYNDLESTFISTCFLDNFFSLDLFSGFFEPSSFQSSYLSIIEINLSAYFGSVAYPAFLRPFAHLT